MSISRGGLQRKFTSCLFCFFFLNLVAFSDCFWPSVRKPFGCTCWLEQNALHGAGAQRPSGDPPPSSKVGVEWPTSGRMSASWPRTALSTLPTSPSRTVLLASPCRIQITNIKKKLGLISSEHRLCTKHYVCCFKNFPSVISSYHYNNSDLILFNYLITIS